MASDTPIELNLEPVFKVMDFMNIPKEDQFYCLRLVQKAYHESIKIMLDKRKKK
jgi:hypothetical protein